MEKPLSVTEVKDIEPRRWTVFTAFHHFPPEVACKLLTEAVRKSDGLCILELGRRTWLDLISMFFALPVHLIVPFFTKQFKWQKFLFTSIIPVIPFVVSFDGVISVLRSYTKEEIIAMLPPGWQKDFDMDYREVRWRFMPLLKASMFSLARK